MSDQQFQRERKRHPDQLATEVITLRRKCRDLEARLDALTGVGTILPEAYTQAIGFAYEVTFGRPIGEATGTRGAPSSRPPSYNVNAMRVLKREQATLHRRSGQIRSEIERAAENPTGPVENRRLAHG